MIGELAVRSPVRLDELEVELLEQRADHRPGHAVAAVEDDLQATRRRAHRVGVDEAQRRTLELRVDVRLAQRTAPLAGRPGLAALDQLADVVDARVARQGQRALAYELRAGVWLRVVRGGAHQPAVEAARSDEPVEHLAADLADVDYLDADRQQALAVVPRELWRAQAHVASKADAKLADVLARESRQHDCEGASDQLGEIAVDLIAVQATDVIGLEDVGKGVFGMRCIL